LILEGVDSSNSYFGGLYQNIGKLMADKIAQAKQAKVLKVNGAC
jgi:hypothetical protein